jgi:hypothetical protein
MNFQRIRSPQCAVVLTCGCALAYLAALNCEIWRPDAAQVQMNAQRWVARYEPLRSLLPADEISRFQIDKKYTDENLQHPDARLYLARCAVVPRRLAYEAKSRWIVVDSDRPDIEPALAKAGRWTLVADLHNGVRLYRIDGNKSSLPPAGEGPGVRERGGGKTVLHSDDPKENRSVLWFLVGLVLPVFAMYPLVACADRGGPRGTATFFLRLGLAFGVGTGIAATAYFLTLFFVDPPGGTYCCVESAVFAAIGAAGWLIHWMGTGSFFGCSCSCSCRVRACTHQILLENGKVRASTHPTGSFNNRDYLIPCFIAALVLAALAAVGRYCRFPLGDWDAWSMWNYRAKVFFHAGDQWRQAFGAEVPHSDYPLLLPCCNARLWSYLGVDASWVPWLTACLFTFGAVAVLTAVVCRLGTVPIFASAKMGLSSLPHVHSRRLWDKNLGLLAGMMLLASVSFLREGTCQFADVPVGFFMLASVATLVLFDAGRGTVPIFAGTARAPPRSGGRRWSSKMGLSPLPQQPSWLLLVLSGLLAGLAGWTKNEGLVFLVVLPAAWGLIACWRGGLKECLQTGPLSPWERVRARAAGEFGIWLVGALPTLAIIVLQKTCIACDNDLAAGQGLHATLARLCDVSRHAQVAGNFLATLVRSTAPAVVVLPLLVWLLGVTKDRQQVRGASTALAAFGLMSSGYYLVCVTTPNNLIWQLDATHRLLMQIWPIGLLGVFSLLAAPEEVPGN